MKNISNDQYKFLDTNLSPFQPFYDDKAQQLCIVKSRKIYISQIDSTDSFNHACFV